MAEARVREHDVVNGRIGCNQPEEKPCPWPLFPQGAAEAPDRKHRRCKKRRLSEVPWLWAVGRTGRSVPIVEKALHRIDREFRGMGANPLDGQTPAVGRICKLAHLLKSREFQFVRIGLQEAD